MTTTCEQYLEDPEAHAGHLEECAPCRALFAELDEAPEVEHHPISVDALPLAPWEGASHRPWGLVVAAALAALALAAALFFASGISPIKGLAGVVTSSMPQPGLLLDIANLAGGAVQKAPVAWQVGIGIAFFAVNALLVVLLRRAPRGIDV